jgi:hypothetical protein
MAQQTTVPTDKSVEAFIQAFVQSEQKKADSFQLIEHMKSWTGNDPKMWGSSIIGFGTYHYRYASGHEGEAPVLGFSPRKAAISLYVYSDTERNRSLLTKLGAFKMGKACIYIKKLSDISIPVLEAISRETIRFLDNRYTSSIKSSEK